MDSFPVHSKEWGLPKGHVEPQENTEETAVREVREETGVWARIRGDLKKVRLTVDEDPIEIKFYLMEGLKEEKPTDPLREHKWLPLEEAERLVSYSESKDLLQLGDQMRRTFQAKSMDK